MKTDVTNESHKIMNIRKVLFAGTLGMCSMTATVVAQENTSDKSKKSSEVPAEITSLRDMMNRIAAARSSLVSYTMELEVSDAPGTERVCGDCSFYYEYSQVGNHYVVVRREHSKRENLVYTSCGGRSGDWFISGNTRESRRLMMYKFDKNRVNWMPNHVDWRAVGLGFCGDMPVRRFEEISGSISDWQRTEGLPIPVEHGIAKYDDQSQVKFEVDFKHGVYPIMFDFTPGLKKSGYSKWTMSVDKVHGEYLPDVATLSCEGKEIVFMFKWLMVNEPIEGGEAALKRIAEKFELDPEKN